MSLILRDVRLGPQMASPCTPESIARAKAAAREELARNGLEQYVDEHGRLSVRVASQTYRTEKFA